MHHAVRWTGLPLPPAADGQACSGGNVRVYVCVWLSSESGPSQSPSVLSVTAPARRRWRVGASSRALGGFPRRRGFSCMCTTWLPVVPVVGATPLCLCMVPRWHRVRCDVRVVCWLDAFTAAWLGGLPFVARVALLACIGGLAFVVCALGGFPALVVACLCFPHHRVSL